MLIGMVAATAVLAAGVAVAVGAVGPGGLGGVGGSGSRGASAAGSEGAPAASRGPSATRHYGGAGDVNASRGAHPTSTDASADPPPALKPLTIKGAENYGEVHAGPAAAPVANLTITNPNGRPVALDAISLSARSDFAITTGSCSTGEAMSPGFVDKESGGGPAQTKGLAAGTSCGVAIRFAPTTLGKRAAALTISYGTGGKTVVHLTGRAFATVKVAVTPDADGHRHGYVDVAADSGTTKCDQAAACTVRYFDAKTPIAVTAHGEPATDDGSGVSGATSGAAGTTGTTGSDGDGGSGDPGDPGTAGGTGGTAASGGGSSTSGGGGDSGGTAGSGDSAGAGDTSYLPDGWTGPCAGSAAECDPTVGGDISTTVHFSPGAS
jgi:hypothetical protein